MKRIIFKGASLNNIRAFPMQAKRDVGFDLDRVQRGMNPRDWKPMPSIGKGVREIRVRDETGAYRVIYVANIGERIYVLTAFQKKRQKTPKTEIDKAKRHYAEITK